MTPSPLVPEGENLRSALKWLGEGGLWSTRDIEEAARRFDLNPLQEEFLLARFRKQSQRSDDRR